MSNYSSSSLRTVLGVITLLMIFMWITPVHAQTEAAQPASQLITQNEPPPKAFNSEGQVPTPPLMAQMAVLVGLSVLPFAVMLMTSFTKIVVVLSLLRSALGVQQAPPNAVINGMALILTIYVMFPTGFAMYNSSKHLIDRPLPTELVSQDTAVLTLQVVDAAKEPLRGFLDRNTKEKHKKSYFQLAYKYFPEEVRSSLSPDDFIVLVPAFVTGQVEDAFQIGVLIYLPFFVIDLVTSNILLAMGMMMLSPMSIALPLKLLLLVMVDGWSLLVQGLVLTYKP